MNGESHGSLSFLSWVSLRIPRKLSDSLETEAVLVVAQPTSKLHPLSLERDDVAPDPNVPADHFPARSLQSSGRSRFWRRTSRPFQSHSCCPVLVSPLDSTTGCVLWL